MDLITHRHVSTITHLCQILRSAFDTICYKPVQSEITAGPGASIGASLKASAEALQEASLVIQERSQTASIGAPEPSLQTDWVELLDLPNELLGTITSECDTEDLRSLRSTCKRLRANATPPFLQLVTLLATIDNDSVDVLDAWTSGPFAQCITSVTLVSWTFTPSHTMDAESQAQYLRRDQNCIRRLVDCLAKFQSLQEINNIHTFDSAADSPQRRTHNLILQQANVDRRFGGFPMVTIFDQSTQPVLATGLTNLTKISFKFSRASAYPQSHDAARLFHIGSSLKLLPNLRDVSICDDLGPCSVSMSLVLSMLRGLNYNPPLHLATLTLIYCKAQTYSCLSTLQKLLAIVQQNITTLTEVSLSTAYQGTTAGIKPHEDEYESSSEDEC